MIPPASFTPPWWSRNPHIQTLLPYLFRRRPRPCYRRERLELPDGDFIDLDWLDAGTGSLTIIVHGLEGSSDSHYVRGLAATLADRDQGLVVMHFRGCSGEINRLNRSYHSGDTTDLSYLIRYLGERFPERPLRAVGYSLGGSVLLNWLIEAGAGSGLTRAATVCVPLRLCAAAERLSSGFSRIYQWRLIRLMRESTQRKFRDRPPDTVPLDLTTLASIQTFREFDNAVTAPLHGFSGVDDYYDRCSVHDRLNGIHTPVLMLQVQDDPFMGHDDLATLSVTNTSITLEVSQHGGHVGFIGQNPAAPATWLDKRLAQWLDQ